MRASSSNDHHSCYSDSIGCDSERNISWGDGDSQHSGGPRSNSSREDDSFSDSYVHSYGSCDSSYDTICSEQRIQEYMNYGPYTSDEESNSREDPGEGESPSETTEEETIPPPPHLSCPLSSGSITALWGPQTSVRWHEQMQTAAAGTNSLFYSWVPSVGPVHATTSSYGQGNIAFGSASLKKRTFYGRS